MLNYKKLCWLFVWQKWWKRVQFFPWETKHVRLTTEESAFSYGNQDEKREHKNQVKRLVVCLGHILSFLNFPFDSKVETVSFLRYGCLEPLLFIGKYAWKRPTNEPAGDSCIWVIDSCRLFYAFCRDSHCLGRSCLLLQFIYGRYGGQN